MRGSVSGAIAQPLRAALTGAHASPGIFVVMAALGRDETMVRLHAVVIVAGKQKAEEEQVVSNAGAEDPGRKGR